MCTDCGKELLNQGDVYCATCGSRTGDDGHDELIGRVLDDRYELQSVLGRGGMGVVYRARHTRLDRIVALKVLRRDFDVDGNAAKRFLREARAIAKLDNPNTVGIYDFGQTADGLLYFSMELLEGASLAQQLVDDGPLDCKQAVALMAQACNSLQDAHEKGILHRDLKPGNLVVVRDEDGGDLLKILDFGLATIGGDELEHLTTPGMVCGTAHYSSPEQVMGEPLDPRTDIYSLAVVLFELLTGRPPFAGQPLPKIVMAHMHDDPPMIADVAPDVEVPPGIEDVIRASLAKNPDERPQCAAEFAAALELALNTGTSPFSAGRLGRSFATGTRVRAAVGLAAALAVLAALLAWWGPWRTPINNDKAGATSSSVASKSTPGPADAAPIGQRPSEVPPAVPDVIEPRPDSATIVTDVPALPPDTPSTFSPDTRDLNNAPDTVADLPDTGPAAEADIPSPISMDAKTGELVSSTDTRNSRIRPVQPRSDAGSKRVPDRKKPEDSKPQIEKKSEYGRIPSGKANQDQPDEEVEKGTEGGSNEYGRIVPLGKKQ